MPTAVQSSITKDMILNISSSNDAYERGEKMYLEGKLLAYNAAKATSGDTNIRASVEGNYKNYDVSIKINPAGAIGSYSCSCEAQSIWQGACKHIIAVIFAHVEGHASNFSADKMRQHVADFTKNMEDIIYTGIDEGYTVPLLGTSGPQMRIYPIINFTNKQRVFVTFAVGHRRMYVVKSISGFVKNIKNNETVTYGQGLTFEHRPEIFDDVSQKLLDFIMREDDMYAEIGKRISRQFQANHHPLIASREMHLTERNIDEFFEIFDGRTLECVADFGQSVKLISNTPPFHLNIRHLASGSVLHADPFEHRTFVGQQYTYILASGGFYRLAKADGLLLTRLLKALDDTPSRELFVSGTDRQRFQTIILPQLKRLGVINNIVGNMPEGEITLLKTHMYFDNDGQDVVGRLEFHYDGTVYDALTDKVITLGDSDGIIRDIVSEYSVKRRLSSLGFYEDKKRNVYRLRGNDLIFAFLYEMESSGFSGIASLKECSDVFVSEDLQKKTVRNTSPKLGLRLSGDLLRVSIDDSGYDVTELLEALDAYRARKKFYRLKDGRFLALNDPSVAAAANFLDALDVSKTQVKGKSLILPTYRALYIDELTKNEALSTTHVLKRDEQFEKLMGNFKNNDSLGFEVPEGLQGDLREYQKAGYTWLKTLSYYGFGGILADDMGLGKTIQVITLLLSERAEGQTSLVVAPTSLLYNWENELNRFAPDLKVQVVSGLPEKRKDLLKQDDIDVFITTYDMLKRDIEAYDAMEFNFIIADEAQNIKNPGTQAAKSIKELKARVRFALTGTPIENTLTELWSIFDFIMPGYLYSNHKFGKLYETPIIKFNDTAKASQLRKQIAPFVLRRVKKSVLLELPEKTETTLLAEFLPEQKKVYQANLLEAIGAFDDIIKTNSFDDNRMKILARLTRLRQICCHPSLFVESYDEGSGKLDLTLETIQLAMDSGHRVLLFSQFTGMLAIIQKALDAAEIKMPNGKPIEYFYLDGSVKAKERMDMTEKFNEGERDLFLISLKAGGAGLNLTGADVVIHYDPWWNPSVMDQASDRAHRYGQEKAVQVFNIVAKDSIEEKIMALQDKKRGLIDSVITEGGSFINLLSEQEVAKLFYT